MHMKGDLSNNKKKRKCEERGGVAGAGLLRQTHKKALVKSMATGNKPNTQVARQKWGRRLNDLSAKEIIIKAPPFLPGGVAPAAIDNAG